MNNFVPVLLFFVLAIMVLVALSLVVSSFNSYAQQLNEAFAQTARRFGGKVIEGDLFRKPAMTFAHGATRGKLDILTVFSGKSAKNYTQVHLTWFDRALRCEIYAEHLQQRLGKLLGVQDIEIGSPEFDRRYLISGNDEQRIRQLLAPPVQQLIETLRSMSSNEYVYVSISGGVFRVQLPGLLETPASLERLVRLATQLYDAMQLPELGITFIDEPQPQLSIGTSEKPPVCQICGDEIHADVVLCSSCKTPHHHDCWNYYGSCSTYACRSRQCFRPKTAGRTTKKK